MHRRHLWLNEEQGLVVLNRTGIFNQHFNDGTFYLTFYFVEQFHGFDDANHFARGDLCAYVGQDGLVWRWTAVERADHRTLDGDQVICLWRLGWFGRSCRRCGSWCGWRCSGGSVNLRGGGGNSYCR